MGNEIGTHSYTHLINPPTVDANGNPVPTQVVSGQTVSTWNENTNTLYVTPPANGSAPNWTFAYEFGTGNSIISQNLGIPVAGAAVPGAPNTVATADKIEQYFQTSALPAGVTGYVNGSWSGVGAGAPNAFGYTDPSDTGSVYIAPNITFDFTEVQYQNKTPAQALADWETLFNQLSANSQNPVIVWPWHDYGPTNFNDDNPGTPNPAGYNQAMFTNFIAYAYNAGYEFVTNEELAARIAAQQAASLSETTSGNTITATITPASKAPDLGGMALNVINGAAGQVIQNAGSYYAYDSKSVFVPYGGGTFTVTLGTSQDDVTHITSLPMRADLLSVSGDGTNLNFSMSGDGQVVVHLKNPSADFVSIQGSPVSASLASNALTLNFADTLTAPNFAPIQHNVAIEEGTTEFATAQNDTVIGTTGNDTFKSPGSGKNTLIGDGGTDTVVFSGTSSNYSVTTNADGSKTVTDLRTGAPDGTDTLVGITNIQYAPPATSAVASASTAPITSTLVLNMSEDASLGDAQFIVDIDNTQFGGTYTATASHAAGLSQNFTISAIPETFSPHDIAISFINGGNSGSPSNGRDLYLNSMQFDNNPVAGASATFLTNGTQHFAASAPANWIG